MGGYLLQGVWVRLGSSIQMAWRGVLSKRLRSALTVLSVVIGVASVVSLMAIGEGARQAVIGQIESLGENVIVIETVSPDVQFRSDLAEELVKRVSTLDYATPVVTTETTIRWRRTRGTVDLLGVNEQFPVIRDHELISGRFFTELHVMQRSRVAVLGYNYGVALLGGRDPVGNTLTLDGRTFRIIGVLAPKGDGKAGGIDNKIVVPYTVAQQIAKTRSVTEIWAKASSTQDSDLAVAQLSRIFKREIGLDPTAPKPSDGSDSDGGMNIDDPGGHSKGSYVEPVPVSPGPSPVPVDSPIFPEQDKKQPVTITNLNNMIREADRANRVLSLLLGGIAAVSLLVGGIGIMNIMLVSVSERTAEIGVRKAIGAKRSDLLIQFLMEAFLLSFAGGVAGLFVGHVTVRLITGYELDAVITLPVAFVAFLLALVVGTVFGVYPAWIASGLQPVEALRRQ
ncbi:MAG: ABC transporter permease [Bacillota bacterium]